MNNIVRTIYGSDLQTCAHLGLPFTLRQHTTLNEKFNINAGVAPTTTEMPKLGYFCIGNGGHKYVTGSNGIPVSKPTQHRATDAALFKHLPFVLRQPDLDLTPAQRAAYGLRKQITHAGRNYIAYYARRFGSNNIDQGMEYRVVNNGVTTVSPFVPNISNLNPSPAELDTTGINVVSGDYIASSAKFTLSLTEEEITEILHACEILYDDEAYGIISEIGLVTGVDKIVSVAGTNGNFNMNEIVAAQVAVHCASHIELPYTKNGFSVVLDIGKSEPLYNIE